MIDQYQVAQSAHTPMNKYTFQNVFEICNRYLYDVFSNSNTKPMTIKILLRMIGLLFFEKEDFDQYNQESVEFANKIMIYVRQNFSILYQSVNQEEWILFRRGLTILLCIELLQYKFNDSNENQISFLQQIPDENQRQIMAYELLDQLYKLDQPIVGNSHWTDLFTLINPTKIDVNQLNLIDSFETFIICIKKISQVLPNDSAFEVHIVDYLENRISNNYLQSKITNFEILIVLINFYLVDLDSILFLLQLLEHDPLNESAIIHWAIRTSSALKQKIKDYFDKLEMTMKNMKEIWLIISSISKIEILNYIDEYQYLRKSLFNVNSANYFIKWSQCFLTKKQIKDDIEKTKYKSLFLIWSNCLKNTYANFILILRAIDQILNAFEQSDDQNWSYLYFIDGIIDLCFEQSNFF
jgi:hypothetical protein